MSDDFAEEQKCSAGAPAWVMTFADLMSLLMCFFVLLLSFATMDTIRFKRMAESFKDAFGVQREIPVYEIVKGTSVVAQHFSPATADPTPLEEVKQTTTDEKKNLDIPEQAKQKVREEMLKAEQERVEAEAQKIRDALKDEISKGLISVETVEQRIIIRIHEKGSFPSGSAVLNAGFEPVMKKIVQTVRESTGAVIVAGHTDDIPISTNWYRSNWELSASRAVTVAHSLLQDGTINPNRMVIEGHAETAPLVPNQSSENRAKNRRVEIILVHKEGTKENEGLEIIEY